MTKGQEVAKKSKRYNIRVLDRAFRVLDHLSDGVPRTLTGLSKELDISSSTVFRLLATLESHNYVAKDDNSGEYRLGLACLELARAYYEANDIRKNAAPFLEGLRDATSETVHLGILDEMDVVYLEKLPGLHAIGLMSSRVGGRAPAYCTGLGKALLSHINLEEIKAFYRQHGLQSFTERTIVDLDRLGEHLAKVKERGYALDQGEHEGEVRCVAAPIFDISGNVVAAISVSGPAGRLEPLEEETDLIKTTIEVSQNISRRLGYRDAAVLDGRPTNF
jgi:DNA-binding IclR family transcriptional regulator